MHDAHSGTTTEAIPRLEELDHGRHSDDVDNTRRRDYDSWLVSKNCPECGGDHIRYKWCQQKALPTARGWFMMCYKCHKKWAQPNLIPYQRLWDK